MRKLLAANFARLWESRMFWVLEGLSFATGVFFYALVAYNTHNLGPGWLEYNAHAYFYLWIFLIPVVIAIFACFFIGTDYFDGTLRNKLIAGRRRGEIYLSNLLMTAAAAFFFLLAYLLAVLLVGLPFSGRAAVTHVQAQPWRLLSCGLATVEFAALFTMTSMLDSDKARNLTISLFLAVAIILAGIGAYGRLSEPERTVRAVAQPDGGFILEDGIPNPLYLSGRIRTMFEWITAAIPSGSIMLSLDRRLDFDWRNPLCAGVLAVFFTVIGIGRFKKKDIK